MGRAQGIDSWGRGTPAGMLVGMLAVVRGDLGVELVQGGERRVRGRGQEGGGVRQPCPLPRLQQLLLPLHKHARKQSSKNGGPR